MRKPSCVDVTATAPRIRQIEQVQRRAEAKPSGSSAVNFTAPQWHEPSRVTGSLDARSIKAASHFLGPLVVPAQRKSQLVMQRHFRIAIQALDRPFLHALEIYGCGAGLIVAPH